VIAVAGCAVPKSDWQSVSDAAIRSTLVSRTVTYDAGYEDSGASQTWFSDGTMNWRGQSGLWRAEDQKYCSMFPDDDVPEWRCYEFAISTDGTQVRFERNRRVWVASFES